MLLRQPNVAGCLGAETLVAATFSAFSIFVVVLAVSVLGMTPMTASVLAATEGATFIVSVFRGGRAWFSACRTGPPCWRRGHSGAEPEPPVVVRRGAGAVRRRADARRGLGLLSLVTTARAGTLPGEKGKVASLFMAAAGLGGATGPAFAGAVAGWFGARAVFVGFVPLYMLLAVSVRAAFLPSPWPALLSSWPARCRHGPVYPGHLSQHLPLEVARINRAMTMGLWGDERTPRHSNHLLRLPP